MVRKLNDTRIDGLLKDQITGRIGCHADGITYVVPVNYVYDGTTIFCHSAKGLKIDMMRKNPAVCFEVDNIKDVTNWESVIAWGTFYEVTEMAEQEDIMQKLSNRIMPYIFDDSIPPSHGFVEEASDVGTAVELIIYKINITKLTGRFEKR
jgi:nitroimidazol reductase NimA-like FMN-containing flavoprotein (pyridoxamine 5'-phosphate oxidase superfamily)